MKKLKIGALGLLVYFLTRSQHKKAFLRLVSVTRSQWQKRLNYLVDLAV